MFLLSPRKRHENEKKNHCTGVLEEKFVFSENKQMHCYLAPERCRMPSSFFMNRNRKQICCFRNLQISHFLDVFKHKRREILCIFEWNTDYHWSIFCAERQPFPKQHFAWPFPITDQINPASWKSFNFSIISFRPGRPTRFMVEAHEWVFSVGCRSVVEAWKYIYGQQSESPSFQ